MPASTDDFIARAVAQATAAHQVREQLHGATQPAAHGGMFVVGSHITIVGSVNDSRVAVGQAQTDCAQGSPATT